MDEDSQNLKMVERPIGARERPIDIKIYLKGGK